MDRVESWCDPINPGYLMSDLHAAVEGKAFAYEKEISSRTSLASIFPNFIYAVERNYLGLT